MLSKINKEFEQKVFGEYEVPEELPFHIAQAPFRKFSKYERDGHWNQKERLKYTVFLGFFHPLLADQDLKKNARVYQMMSDMIITRNPSQCRSHHQKMEKYRSTIEDIILSVTEKYQPGVFEDIKKRYTVFIKTLLQNSDKYVRLPTNNEKKRPMLKKVSSKGSKLSKKIGERIFEDDAIEQPEGEEFFDDERENMVVKKAQKIIRTKGSYSEDEKENQEEDNLNVEGKVEGCQIDRLGYDLDQDIKRSSKRNFEEMESEKEEQQLPKCKPSIFEDKGAYIQHVKEEPRNSSDPLDLEQQPEELPQKSKTGIIFKTSDIYSSQEHAQAMNYQEGSSGHNVITPQPCPNYYVMVQPPFQPGALQLEYHKQGLEQQRKKCQLKMKQCTEQWNASHFQYTQLGIQIEQIKMMQVIGMVNQPL